MHVEIRATSEDTAIKARCYATGFFDKELKYAVVVGPEQTVVGIHTNMVKPDTIITVDGYNVIKCQYFYRRIIGPMSCKWISALVLSKDPRVMLQDDDAHLLAAIKRLTETPMLPAWIPYVRGQLTKYSLLKKLTGLHAQGSLLECDTEKMDSIVRHGVERGFIKIQTE